MEKFTQEYILKYTLVFVVRVKAREKLNGKYELYPKTYENKKNRKILPCPKLKMSICILEKLSFP